MDDGISAAEACATRSLDPQDYARMCNEDGTLKEQRATSTFHLKDYPAKSITVDNITLQILFAGLVVFILAGNVYSVKRNRKK